MRKREPRKKPLWIRILGATFYIAFCGAILSASSVAGWLMQSDMGRLVVTRTIWPKDPDEVFNGQDMTILVLGCDEDRSQGGGARVLRENARSDMMLVAKLDFRHNRITGVSIPRDLLVELPGYPMQKINGYHSKGGKELSKDAVEYVLGIKIDKVVEINYQALQEMVDLVGGVEVYVPKRMKYTDKAGKLFIDLEPGRQVLDGYNAMCYVRYRKGDSDMHRQERQKDFMMAFKQKVVQKPMLLPKVADKSVDLMGGNLTAEEVYALGLFAQKIGAENVKLGVVPVLDAPNYNLIINRRLLPQTLREYNLVDDTRLTYYAP
jgi:polyisoprenyl-teichoic acid--peptidoglycan teichoic acid transferase